VFLLGVFYICYDRIIPKKVQFVEIPLPCLVPKKKQDIYTVILGFGGLDISREGELSLIAFTFLDGRTWIVDLNSKAFSLMFWSKAKKFFSDPFIEKVVFDSKHVADYMLHVQEIELKGVYDLLVIEAMERCTLPSVQMLPTVSGTEKVVDRELFLNMELIAQCYLAEDYSCLDKLDFTNIEDSDVWNPWDIGIVVAEIPNQKAIKWMIDHQRFMLHFFKKFNFVAAFRNRKYMKWMVSSARYSKLLSEMKFRFYDENEYSPLIPNYILSFKGTDQPLGICRCERCSRFLPTKDFSHEMLCNLRAKICITCLKIHNSVLKRSGNKVVKKTISKKELQIPDNKERNVVEEVKAIKRNSIKRQEIAVKSRDHQIKRLKKRV